LLRTVLGAGQACGVGELSLLPTVAFSSTSASASGGVSGSGAASLSGGTATPALLRGDPLAWHVVLEQMCDAEALALPLFTAAALSDEPFDPVAAAESQLQVGGSHVGGSQLGEWQLGGSQGSQRPGGEKGSPISPAMESGPMEKRLSRIRSMMGAGGGASPARGGGGLDTPTARSLSLYIPQSPNFTSNPLSRALTPKSSVRAVRSFRFGDVPAAAHMEPLALDAATHVVDDDEDDEEEEEEDGGGRETQRREEEEAGASGSVAATESGVHVHSNGSVASTASKQPRAPPVRSPWKGLEPPRTPSMRSLPGALSTERGTSRSFFGEEAVGMGMGMGGESFEARASVASSSSASSSSGSSAVRVTGHKLLPNVLQGLVKRDPLSALATMERAMLVAYREALVNVPLALPKFLQAVTWYDRSQASHAHSLIYQWSLLPRQRALRYLELLDKWSADQQVRHLACEVLRTCSHDDLARILPQLSQALKFESHATSSLWLLLLERALAAPLTVAPALYWSLRVEAGTSALAHARFAMLQSLLVGRVPLLLRDVLATQVRLWGKHGVFAGVCRAMKEAKKRGASKATLKALLIETLRALKDQLPAASILPLDGRLEVGELIPEDCRVLDSAKLPIWLVFRSNDPDDDDDCDGGSDGPGRDEAGVGVVEVGDGVEGDGAAGGAEGSSVVVGGSGGVVGGSGAVSGGAVSGGTSGAVSGGGTGGAQKRKPGKMRVIFKAGDDVRQDTLTLQILRVLQRMWHEAGVHVSMTPYRCMATWETGGLVEVVPRSQTTAEIHKSYGGAFRDEAIQRWISEHNGPVGSEGYAAAADRFLRSSAAYCVATYVLGIGDRHNDNIMVKESGELFHIDFGHFLGNWKYQFNIKRERTAFVLTPEMAAVMGGVGSREFERFLQLCCDALEVVRANGPELINLLALMIAAGMPELRSREDVHYIRDMLALDKSAADAALAFRAEAAKALADVYRRVDNQLHIWAHG
jgi:Phosphatidylinositol 3- and 4-kinase/Phosphoinositide 3-kinase family, accessory domain (PIK domain)